MAVAALEEVLGLRLAAVHGILVEFRINHLGKIAWSVAGIAAVSLLLSARPLSVVEKITHSKADLLLPLNLECVVTIENEAWMSNVSTHSPGTTSGFLRDFTIQGKLLEVGPEWVVIGEGTYENWISRDRVVNIRASR